MPTVEEAKKTLSYKKANLLPKNESNAFPVLYVFRHGQSQDNADFIFSGWRESKLTETGIKQAENLDERIKERSYGELQGTSKLELFLKNPELLNEYRRSYTKRAQNGESLEDVVKRVNLFCKDLVKQMKNGKMNVAVSCHGNSMRGFRKYFEGLSIEQTCDIETPLGQDYASYIVQ